MASEIQKRNISEDVMKRIKQLQSQNEVALPQDYHAGNALKQAWLMLQDMETKDKKPVLQVCTQDSISIALLSMCVQGLNPAIQQCYFVPYGNKLQIMRSYFGTMALTKRIDCVIDVRAQVVYKDDKITAIVNPYTATLEVTKHEFNLFNRKDEDIIGAYAVVITDESIPSYTEYMSMDQIKQAWNQGYNRGNSPAHKNFPDQMAKKTVISRACKYFANTVTGMAAQMIVTDVDEGDYEHPLNIQEYTVEDEQESELIAPMAMDLIAQSAEMQQVAVPF